MSRTGQKVGLKRDVAKAAVPPAYDPHLVKTIPWQPRAAEDDRRAILASARSAVFDRTAPEVLRARVAEAPAAEAAVGETSRLGPLPTTWTPDLVHCRLRAVHCMCLWLPRISWPAGFRSVLQQLQPSESRTGQGRVLTAAEMDRMDWTLARVCAWPEDDQMIIRGFMAMLSLREIAEELKRLRLHGIGGRKGIGKSTVPRRYRSLLTTMATEWIEHGEPIDRDTCRVWSSGGNDL